MLLSALSFRPPSHHSASLSPRTTVGLRPGKEPHLGHLGPLGSDGRAHQRQQIVVRITIIMAVRKRRPRGTLIHSDQGVRYGSDDWRRFCKSNRLEPSMSRKGNCWDNAVAESFLGSLKKERVKKHIYRSREAAELRGHGLRSTKKYSHQTPSTQPWELHTAISSGPLVPASQRRS